MGEYDAVLVGIGGRHHLDDATLKRMAEGLATLHENQPAASILLWLDGYDDDPRELWEIPEAAGYIRRFARSAGLADWRGELFQALDQSSVALLVACEAVDQPHPFIVHYPH